MVKIPILLTKNGKFAIINLIKEKIQVILPEGQSRRKSMTQSYRAYDMAASCKKE